MLGAPLALAPQPFFGTYARPLGPRAALDDQQLAELIIWVPMGSIYLLAALVLAGARSAHRIYRIDFIQSRHEELAAFMACAHAKVDG